MLFYIFPELLKISVSIQSTPNWQGLGHQDQSEGGLETLLEMRHGQAESPCADIKSGKSSSSGHYVEYILAIKEKL